jgi:hypothetical protein
VVDEPRADDCVGNTRVLPEDLSQTAARLRPIFERLAREER